MHEPFRPVGHGNGRPGLPLNSLREGQRVRTIRGTLIWMVVICVLPAWIGFAVLIQGMYSSERERAAQNTMMTARALMLTVDRELAATRAAVEVLATCPELVSDDLAAFHKRASGMVRKLSGNNIVLIEQSGRQLLNTLVPFGTPVPFGGRPPPRGGQLPRIALDRSTFSTGKPVITDLFFGPVARAPLVAIEVPVFRDGKVKYGLSMALSPEHLGQILDRQKLPPAWVASIFDTNGVTVARTRSPAEFVGLPGPPALIEMVKQEPNGFLETLTLEGFPVYWAFSRSETSHWSVAIGIPTAEMNNDLHTFLGMSAIGAVLILMIGIGLAAYRSSRITSAVRALVAPAMAFGRGEAPTIPRSNIQEIGEVAAGLEKAFHVLQHRTAERDQAEREKEAAERASLLKDEFIATVSHELRTPLTSIAASLDLLKEIADATRSDAGRELIGIAQANGQRLTRLVNDILDIEKLEGGRVVFEMQRVGIAPLLARAVEVDRPMAQRCGVRLRLENSSVHDVQADPNRLMQVAANLLSNAVKFSPPGAEIVVAAEDRGDNVRLSVRDHGPGVPEEFRARIFGKFAQADNSDTRQRTGTGLGLSIVKQIAQRLGGEVGFADAPGGGTVFFVELPRLQGIDAGNARDADGRSPPEGNTGSAGHSARPSAAPSVPEFAKASHA
jgi:two-component system, sensor histidine kinase and response regulator